MIRRILFCLLVLSLLALQACGGGGCNPCEPDVPSPNLNCSKNPGGCK